MRYGRALQQVERARQDMEDERGVASDAAGNDIVAGDGEQALGYGDSGIQQRLERAKATGLESVLVTQPYLELGGAPPAALRTWTVPPTVTFMSPMSMGALAGRIPSPRRTRLLGIASATSIVSASNRPRSASVPPPVPAFPAEPLLEDEEPGTSRGGTL